MAQTTFADGTLACLLMAEPGEKCAATTALWSDWQTGLLEPPAPETTAEVVDIPGRPARPQLVPHTEIGRHSIHTRQGHAALIHALAHIEFNAINLALDAAYRFRGLPREYYGDWLQVAAEEAHHFSLLRAHLRTLGSDYGEFPAHDGLWQMCRRTAHDPLIRMALVPRLLEARGLDVSPAIIRKLTDIKDSRGVEILEVILRDEIGHVRIGNRWYAYSCTQRGLDPALEFQRLLQVYDVPTPRPPLHRDARLLAGFSEAELAILEGVARKRQPGP
jgi:uncharacterized ferritin-like protein (DUF455 family)